MHQPPAALRPGVGLMLINRVGKIFVARHIDGDGSDWRMPQGGIHRGETPRDAVLRELRDQLSISNVEILAESPVWLSHDAVDWRQKWFLALFKGRDGDISLSTDSPEFDTWRWVSPVELTAIAGWLKRQLYLDILGEFSGAINEVMMLISASPIADTSSRTNSLRFRKDVVLIDTEGERLDAGPLSITDGEVNFIDGFMHDGSIGAECGLQLMRYWGYCERHAWVSLAVEMSMLHGFCSRSASLYTDILRQGSAALAGDNRRAVPKQLREGGSCMICNANPRWRGLLSRADLAKAKDPSPLRSFAQGCAPFWQQDCCPQCITGVTGGHLCRRHMSEALREGASLDLANERKYLMNMLARLENYAWSFSWGFRGLDGPEDRAALISAIGWCSGWASLGALIPLDYLLPSRSGA
jgi:putative (di)nucleoside polyphosphate hydrolase